MKKTTLLAGLIGLGPCTAAADMLELDAACETALALSAGPATVSEQAGIYLLTDTGYEKVRESGNGFYCLVERNHPDSVIPQCFDPASKNANLQVVLDEGRLLRAGQSFGEVAERRRQLLDAGEVPVASGPGIVYMISDYNYIHVASQDRIVKVGPHVMFHAPGLSNEDIGASPQAAFANPGLPIVTAPGPHGFMTSFVSHSSDSAAVVEHCAGQLPDRSRMPSFPPQARGD